MFTNQFGSATTKTVTLTNEPQRKPIITLDTASTFPIFQVSAGGTVNLLSDAISTPPANSQWQVSTTLQRRAGEAARSSSH